ncbi:serine/threonine protein kinase [Candidatus Woesearchaeota archaeon]|nr:MAG: serine/threonine protein kinase [Candidatus Woesearchaeota archaeon]
MFLNCCLFLPPMSIEKTFEGEVDQYTPIEKIDRGGQGEKYIAVDTLKNQRLLKIPNNSKDESASRAFYVLDSILKEQDALRTVKHPSIVELKDVSKAKSEPFNVLEYIEGFDLDRIITSERPYPVQLCVKIATELCDALAEVHKHNLYHGDVKPGNIMMTNDGKIKLIDFGLSGVPGKTLRCFMGTPHFAAPEQIDRKPELASDIYSAGLTLYALLAGEPPFIGGSYRVVCKQLKEDTPDIREKNPAVPCDLAEIISKATRKKVSERYESAEEMAEALRKSSQAYFDSLEVYFPGCFDSKGNEKISTQTTIKGLKATYK